MATYTITAAGSGLKVVTDSGRSAFFAKPQLVLTPSGVYPFGLPALEIKTDQTSIRLTTADTITVAGVAGAGTLIGLFDQISAILPSTGGNGTATIDSAQLQAELTNVELKLRQPGLLTASASLPTDSQLQIFWHSETALPGEDLSIQGYFPADATVRMAFPDTSRYITLPVVVQAANIAIVQLPPSLAFGVYTLWVQTATARSATVHVNKVRATAFDSPVIYANGPLRIKGQNLQYGSVRPSVRFVSQTDGTVCYGTPVAEDSDAYSLRLTAPPDLVTGQSYKVFVNNGYDPSVDGVQVIDEEQGTAYVITAIAPQEDIYDLRVGWSAKFSPPTVTTLTGFNNNQTGFIAAWQSAVNAFNEVRLPDGDYNLSEGTAGSWTPINIPSNSVTRAVNNGKVKFNFGTTYSKVIFIAPNVAQVGFIGIGFNSTNTSSSAAGLGLNQGNFVFLKNCTFNAQKAQCFWSESGMGLLIDNCVFDGYGSADNTSFLRTDNYNYVTVRGSKTRGFNSIQLLRTSKFWVFGNTLLRDWNRPKAQVSDTIHYLVIDYVKSGYVAHNQFLLTGAVARDGNGKPLHNDGEPIIAEVTMTERGDYRNGPVSSAGASTLTDSTASFPAFIRPTSVAIVKGKGLGQTRKVVSNTNTVLTLDKAWDIVPDATSIYQTFNWCLENVAIVGNNFERNQRGITIYHAPTRGLYIVSNQFINSGAIDLTLIQQTDGTARLMIPTYNVNVLDNTANSLSDPYQGTGMGVKVMQYGEPKTWGTSCINYRSGRNRITNPATAIDLVQDNDFAAGYAVYMIYQTLGQPFVDENVAAILGSIMTDDVAIGGSEAVTLGVGTCYTSIRRPGLLGPVLINERNSTGVSHGSTATITTN